MKKITQYTWILFLNSNNFLTISGVKPSYFKNNNNNNNNKDKNYILNVLY